MIYGRLWWTFLKVAKIQVFGGKFLAKGSAIVPTRMELGRLRKRLLVARHGHKMLKDKRDEMMKQFLSLIKITKKCREKVDVALKGISRSMLKASSEMSADVLKTALMYSKQRLSVGIKYRSILNLKVPSFFINKNYNEDFACPYGLAQTYIGLDDILKDLFSVFKYMLELAECENACRILSLELQKSNRRVNALEHIVIPQTSESIKYISAKIDELELSTAIRLLKVKDMVSK